MQPHVSEAVSAEKSFAAVSYTHLDVYKRQGQCRWFDRIYDTVTVAAADILSVSGWSRQETFWYGNRRSKL